MLKPLLVSVSLMLAGCSGVGNYHTDKTALDKADLHFIGAPGLIGAVGSSFPITPKYSLTAAHVARVMLVKVKAYDPVCDVAIIYHDNRKIKQFPVLRAARLNETVTIYGYNAYTVLPSAGTGKVFRMDYYTGKSDSCFTAASTAGGVQGMSGGPVVGDNGDIVGVFFGTNPRMKATIFTPYQSVRNFIDENTK